MMVTTCSAAGGERHKRAAWTWDSMNLLLSQNREVDQEVESLVPSREDARPNIVMILADDMGYVHPEASGTVGWETGVWNVLVPRSSIANTNLTPPRPHTTCSTKTDSATYRATVARYPHRTLISWQQAE